MIKVRIQGLRELDREMQKVSRELMEAEDPAQMAAGEPIREKWASLVPVLDGNYKRALTVRWLGKKGAAVAVGWLGDIDRNDEPILYSKRLEFGDSEIPAQPSARPALAAAQQQALEAGAEPFRTVVRGRRGRRIPAA